MTEARKKTLGLMAQFAGQAELLVAARTLKQRGYCHFECHSPFPIHGMDEAAGEKRSRVSLVAGILAAVGLIGALSLQGWMSAVDYPHVVSGKPFFSFQAFFPITFALAVLGAAFGATFAFLGFIKLRLHHPVFYSDRFKQFSDDGFFLSIEANDPQFDLFKTRELLESLGGMNVEVLEGE